MYSALSTEDVIRESCEAKTLVIYRCTLSESMDIQSFLVHGDNNKIECKLITWSPGKDMRITCKRPK
jgi:hypothetical protein